MDVATDNDLPLQQVVNASIDNDILLQFACYPCTDFFEETDDDQLTSCGLSMTVSNEDFEPNNVSTVEQIKVENDEEQSSITELVSVELELYNESISKPLNSNPSTIDRLTAIDGRNSHARRSSKSYKCVLCHEDFLSFALFSGHQCGTGHYECDKCKKQFVNPAQLTKHSNWHLANKPHECHLCGKEFARVEHLERHIQTHSGRKRFHCDHCGKGFIERGPLIMHIRTHTGEKPYECTHCPFKFAVKWQLKQHIRRHFGVKPYKCGHCDQCFVNSQLMKEHERKHTGEKPLGCKHCGKVFARRSKLNAHVTIHSDARPYRCEVCNMGFKRRAHLNVHTQRKDIHAHIVKENCDACGAKFSSSRAAVSHEKTFKGICALSRDGCKSFTCDKCDKRYLTSVGISNHLVSHSGLSHRCDVCGKRFGSSMALEKHQLAHVDRDSIHCDSCGKYFQQKLSFDRHVCANIPCRLCDRKFRYPWHLKTHMKKKHGSGRRLFRCSRCDKKYETNVQLLTHLETHEDLTGETSELHYVCCMCPVKFDCKEHLMTHWIQHDTATHFYSDDTNVTDTSTSNTHVTKSEEEPADHVTSPAEPIKCRKCRLTFSSSLSAERHFKEHCWLLKHVTVSLTKCSTNNNLLDLVAALLS